MRETFDRIVSLPPERSDNTGRISRVADFARARFGATHVPRLLDIGAGLGVFPFNMKQLGWACTALDPDPRAGAHLRNVVGVDTIIGDFFSTTFDGKYFDVITLNKVLEHVEDPVAMLLKCAIVLARNGFIYVEVPDIAAAVEGSGREEYFIEHYHVFSPASLALCGERAGLSLAQTFRLREPSGKYTLVGFFITN
jgi:SAM-dependent methyltransferase